MKKILIVSPRFPPTSAADHHRVRMMLPFLAENGWEATVLAIDPEFVEAPIESDLLRTVPDSTRVVRCKAVSQKITRKAGFGSLTLRALSSLRSAGDEILSSDQFDLVFFSTTEFGVIPLGTRWKKKFKVPFVVDLQDPWVNTYYDDTGSAPPGGRVKHFLTQFTARRQEGPTLAQAAGIISVSSAYPTRVIERHPGVRNVPLAVIPFAGSRSDFQIATGIESDKPFALPRDGRMHWVYAGTAPPGIRASVVPFLDALKAAFAEGLIPRNSVLCHFIGTDYAPADEARPRVLPIASELGMEEVIAEHPGRIGYMDTLRVLVSADALIVFGWDDPGYTASKIYPYILAERPLLSILHEESSAIGVVERSNAGVSVAFGPASDTKSVAASILDRWFRTGAHKTVPTTNWSVFAEYTAETMTKRATSFFDKVVSS
jgi:hypothetical protein